MVFGGGAALGLYSSLRCSLFCTLHYAGGWWARRRQLRCWKDILQNRFPPLSNLCSGMVRLAGRVICRLFMRSFSWDGRGMPHQVVCLWRIDLVLSPVWTLLRRSFVVTLDAVGRTISRRIYSSVQVPFALRSSAVFFPLPLPLMVRIYYLWFLPAALWLLPTTPWRRRAVTLPGVNRKNRRTFNACPI